MSKPLTPELVAALISKAVADVAVEMSEQIEELDLKEAKHEWQGFECQLEGGGVLKIGKLTLIVTK